MFKVNNKLTIAFSNKSELVSVIKDMILKNELDISFAHDFVDLDKIREEMIMYSTPLDMYNEYDNKHLLWLNYLYAPSKG